MADEQEPPTKKPTRLRGVAGKRSDKRPAERKDRLVKTTGPSGTLRDGRVVFQAGEPLVDLYTIDFTVAVEDVLLFLRRFTRHVEESMAREDDAYIDANFEVGVETRIQPGANPHVIGGIQIVPRWRRPRKPEGEGGQ